MSNIAYIHYCLQVRDSFGRAFRKRGHNLLLPLVPTNLHKESVIVMCFFRYGYNDMYVEL